MASLRGSNGTTPSYSLDSVASSSLGGSFLRCWTSSYGLEVWSLFAAVYTRNCSQVHCAPPTLCSWISVRLCSYAYVISPYHHLFQTYLCGVRTFSVRGTVRTFPVDCRYYDRINILCKTLKYNDATCHWSVFVHSLVSPSVKGQNILKHRQSVFRA
jgi:hypothetical protein